MAASLSDQAYEIIKRDIIVCSLEPGQQIAQRQLVERHGLGTTPVREALRRLSQEGLVQTIPRFGYVVSPVTVSDVREIYELRSILESSAVRFAVARATQEQLEHVRQEAGFGYIFRDRQSYSVFLTHNAAFHRSIAMLADNRRLAEQLSKLLDEMTRIFHLGLDLRDSAGEMREEHLALARALCLRDAELAEQVVRSQIARSQERVFEALTRLPATGGGAIQIKPSDLS